MRRGLSAALVLLTLLAVPGQARADHHDEAKAMFRRGLDRFRTGDYVEALRYYKRAYARAAVPKILLSTAACLVQLRRYADAAIVYERYLGTADDPQRADKVRVALRAIRKLVGTLHVAIGGPRVRIVVDGESVAAKTAPVRIPIDPGSHTVLVKQAGVVLADVTIRAKAGKVYVIPLRRRALPRPQSDKPERTPSPASDNLRTLAKWATATGAVALGVGMKFGFDARRISDELSSHNGPWTRELLAKQQEGRSAQNTMWVFTGIGAAAVVTGGVLYLLGRSAARDSQSTEVSVTASSTNLVFGVAGRF